MKKKSLVQRVVGGEYKKYLPSRRVGILIGGVFLCMVLFVVIRNSRGVSYNTKNLSVVTVGGVVQQDTDGDGITDWEERLWGTNPRNSDSDGDGVPDGTEISAERDRLAIQNGVDGKEVSLSETDKFARGLFATYSALSEKGTVNDTAASALAGAAVTTMAGQLPKIQQVSAADLKIVPATTASNRAYRENLAALVTKNKDFGKDFNLVISGVSDSNADTLRDARKYTKYYTDLKIGLLKTNVPENQIQNHIRLTNDISKLAASLPQIDAIVEDVVLGLPIYTMYTESYEDMLLAFDTIANQQ